MSAAAKAWFGPLWALALIGVPAEATPPVDAYGALPSVDHVTLSPDGSRLALVTGSAEIRQIQVRDTDTLKVLTVITTSRTKLRFLMWAGRRHLIIVSSKAAQVNGLSGGTREYMLAVDYNIDTGKLTPLLSNAENSLNTIYARPTIVQTEGHIFVYLKGISFPGQKGIVTVFRDDLDTGGETVVRVGNEQTRDFLVDNKGAVVARADYEEQSGRWSLWTAPKGDHFEKALSLHAPLDSPSLAGFDTDQRTLIVRTEDEDGSVFRRIALGGHDLSPPIEQYRDSDIVRDPTTRTVIGVVHEDLETLDYRLIAPSDQALWTKTQRAFPGAVVELVSWSEDRTRLVLKVEGGSTGAGYFLLNRVTRRADWLADEYDGIGPEDIAPVSTMRYAAADGTSIPAYLTLPRDATAKGLPLVVLVHGGPAARDDPGFDWWSQALASRGYAVLQPQYRGSAGFGAEFMRSGYGQWGRKMQTDVSDGVAALVKNGTVDPARVCIVGGSYGGYAALAGVTLQSGIYACAVSLAGPSDLRRMISYETGLNGGSKNETVRYWKRFMGAASSTDTVLDAMSPAKLASQANVPILLIHGRDDTVVSVDQSRIMSDALRRAGRPAELVLLKGEDHWLSLSDTRKQMLNATATFLATYLRPAKRSSESSVDK